MLDIITTRTPPIAVIEVFSHDDVFVDLGSQGRRNRPAGPGKSSISCNDDVLFYPITHVQK